MTGGPVDVALVLTDVEGSTPAWEEDAKAMHAAMAVHDVAIASVISDHGGRLHRERGEGDSTFSVFDDPVRAVDAAAAALVALRRSGFPHEVRVGVYVGPVSTRDGEFYGTTPNRAARLRGLAQGGQVVVGGAVAALVDGHLADGATLVDLGTHELVGVSTPEQVFGVAHPSLAPPAPLGEVEPPPTNMPAEVDRFVGREQELIALEKAMRAHRIVSIVGPGGVGKSRLALAAARQAPQQGGIFYLDVAGLSDGTQIGTAAAEACRAEIAPGDDPVVATARAIDAPTLLVLDTSERHIDAVADLVASLTTSAPDLSVLVTGREPLDVAGETILRLDPMEVSEATPDAGRARSSNIDDSLSEAAELFVHRLNSRLISSDADDHSEPEYDASVVEAICRMVDGIPLALELAAARAAEVEIGEVARALAAGGDDRRGVQAGRRGGPTRQRSLEATIAWSHHDLDDVAATVFRRLATFTGGWPDDDAAVAVVGDPRTKSAVPDPDDERDGDDEWRSLVVSAVHLLLRRSLVVERNGRPRLLDTVRAFAADRLDEAGETDAVAGRHVRWAIERGWALDRDPAVSGGPEVAREMPNLRQAFHQSVTAGRAHEAQNLGEVMFARHMNVGAFDEIERVLRSAIELGGAGDARAGVLSALAMLVQFTDRDAEADAMLDEAKSIVGDDETQAAGNVWMVEAMAANRADDRPRMLHAARRSLAAARVSGEPTVINVAVHNLAAALRPVEDHRERVALALEAGRLEAEAGGVVVSARIASAVILGRDGRAGEALARLDEIDPVRFDDVLSWLETRSRLERLVERPSASLVAADEMCAVADQVDSNRARGLATVCRAEALTAGGNLDEAWDVLISVEPGYQELVVEHRGACINVLLEAGRWEEANALISSAVGHESPEHAVTRWRVEQAALLVATGDPQAALDLVMPERRRMAEAGVRHDEAKSLTVEVAAAEALGHDVDERRGRLDELQRLRLEGVPPPTLNFPSSSFGQADR